MTYKLISPRKPFFSAIAVGLCLLTACSTPKPANLSESSNASEEITKTEAKMKESVDQQSDVFAPRTYSAAAKTLSRAKELRSDNAANNAVLVEVERANALFEKANHKAEISKGALPGVADERMAAINAGAQKLLTKQFNAADDNLAKYAASAEEGKISNPDKVADQFKKEFRTLEVNGTLESKIGSAGTSISRLRDEGAKEFAPKTWAATNAAYDKAEDLIRKDPRNSAAIDEAAGNANFMAEKLVRVTRATKAAGSAKAEELVLKNEAQQKYIGAQKQALSTVTAQKQQVERRAEGLQKVKDLQDKVATISAKFDPSEAEVYQQGNAVIVRLKNIKFEKNKAEVPTDSFETLKKVQESIAIFDKPSVDVQGHTDSTGTSAINMPLSEKRAEAVKKYIAANSDISPDQLQSEGFGSSRPLKSNKTAAGRAVNRRIDIVINAAPSAASNATTTPVDMSDDSAR